MISKALRLWHLLSLDAPTVAALWCWAFGIAARLHLAPSLPVALALGTWLFYVADRLLDAHIAPPETLRARHHFHRAHQPAFLLACLPVAATLAVLVAHIPRSLLLDYVALGLLSALYLACVHLPAGPLRWFPKEFLVALLFAAATALPAFDEARRRAAGMPRAHPLLLLCPLFAALCWLNCMAIDEWEAERRPRTHHAARLASVTAAAGVLCLAGLVSDGARMLAVLGVTSAVLFLLLDRSRLRASARRIAADLVLLTPLLLLAVHPAPRSHAPAAAQRRA